jgi:hypothetical protein
VFHGVDGVQAVDLNRLHLTNDPLAPLSDLTARHPAGRFRRLDGDSLLPAQLLLLAGDGVSLSEMTA